MSEEERARELIAKADKKLKGFKLFGKPYEECLELYEKAANLLKIAKEWQEAGDTFKKMYECHMKLDSPYEAANALMDAANCYRKTNPVDAIECMKKAATMMTEAGRFAQAAKVQKEIGELFEGEVQYEKAIEAFQAAVDYFAAENQPGGANPCRVKIATLSAELEDYDRAIAEFEELARVSLENNLLRYGVKEYLFKAMLCHFAAMKGVERGPDDARQHLERYERMDVTFSDAREAKLCWGMVDAFDKRDVDIFSNAVAEFDRVSRLDDWKVSMLLKIRKKLEETEADLT